MSDLVLRLARPGEDARIADFINQNFDMRLPLINRADFYQFYYAHTPGAAPQFALAEQDGRNSVRRRVHSGQPERNAGHLGFSLGCRKGP